MSTDETVASSTTNEQQTPADPADLFYTKQPEAESAPANEETSSEPPSEEEASETESGSEPEAETEEETETDTEQPKPGPKPGAKAERRIKELLRDKQELERKLAETGKPAETQPPKQDEAPPPDPKDFDTWALFRKAEAEYNAKLTEKQVKDAIEKDRKERERQAQEEAQKDALEKSHKAWNDQVAASAKRHLDFKKRVLDDEGNLRSDLQLSPTFDALIPQSPHGAEVLYHLAANPKEAERLAGLAGYEALREFVTLETKLAESLKNLPLKKKPTPPSTVSAKGTPPQQKSAEEVLYGKG